MAHLRTVSTALVLGWLVLAASPACSGGSSTTSSGLAAEAGAEDSAVSGNDAPTGDSASGAMDATAEATVDASGDVSASGDAGVGDAGDAAGNDGSTASSGCTGQSGLDPSFGTQGIVELAVPRKLSPAFKHELLTQPDGKILVLGLYGLLGRYNTDGSLDTTFGVDGFTTITPEAPDAAPVTVEALALALQSNGSILVGGASYPSATAYPNTAFIARFDTTGALDTTFGTGGYAVEPAAKFDALAVRPDDSILLAGDQAASQFVVHYDGTGALDTAFGSGGFVTIAYEGLPVSALLQSDGMLVVGGWTYDNSGEVPMVARYTTAGALDTTFGTGGVVQLDLGLSYPTVAGVVQQSTGALVAAIGGTGGSLDNFIAVRLTPTGQTDTTFGVNGVAQAGVFGGAEVGVSLLAGDAVLIAGAATPADAGTPTGLGLAQYTANGALDPAFASAGTLAVPLAGQTNLFVGAQTLTPNGALLVAVFATAPELDGGSGTQMLLDLVRVCP